MPIQDFYRATTKYFYIDMVVSGSVPDISGDTMDFYMRDEDELILTASADMATSGSIGRAIFNISSSITDIPAECYQYEIYWHRSNGQDYVIDKSSVNVKSRVSGSV